MRPTSQPSADVMLALQSSVDADSVHGLGGKTLVLVTAKSDRCDSISGPKNTFPDSGNDVLFAPASCTFVDGSALDVTTDANEIPVSCIVDHLPKLREHVPVTESFHVKSGAYCCSCTKTVVANSFAIPCVHYVSQNGAPCIPLSPARSHLAVAMLYRPFDRGRLTTMMMFLNNIDATTITLTDSNGDIDTTMTTTNDIDGMFVSHNVEPRSSTRIKSNLSNCPDSKDTIIGGLLAPGRNNSSKDFVDSSTLTGVTVCLVGVHTLPLATLLKTGCPWCNTSCHALLS